MAKTQYKYNLKHFISFQPQYWTIDKIASAVEKLGIPRRTFDRDKALTIDEDADIPGERLFIYSCLFDCSIDQLVNYRNEKRVKPLHQRKLSPEMVKMMKKNNLKFPEGNPLNDQLK